MTHSLRGPAWAERLPVARSTRFGLCVFTNRASVRSIAMSLLHRLSLLQKFVILGAIGLMMSALPTYLYVSNALQSIAAAPP